MRVSLLFAAALAGLALSGCDASNVSANRGPCPTGKLCFETGNYADPVSLDPHIVTGMNEARIMRDLLIGLTMDGPNDEVLPGMATSWETSPDGKIWTFHLRQAIWSDGVPVTADDFVFSLQRILDPATAAEYASLLYVLKNAQPISEGKLPTSALGVRALGPRTLEITLEHPAPYLLQLAKHQTMSPVPAHAVRKWGDKWTQPAHFVSNGPYRLRSWSLQKNLILDKSPTYWDAKKVCFDQVAYYPTEDDITAERQVERGELDANNKVKTSRVGYLREPGRMPQFMRTHTYLSIYYFAFNTQLPKFQDPRVRKALSMSVDREFLSYGVSKDSGTEPAYKFVPPGVANYTEVAKPDWASWPFEQKQKEARRLLAEAGYGRDNPLQVEIMTSNIEENALVVAIQADWRAIGVNASIIRSEFPVALQSYRMKNFEISYSGWIADYNDPLAFLYLMHSSTGGMNYGSYNSPRYDALLEASDNEPDIAKRAALLGEAEKQMLSDMPVMPLFHTANANLVAPRVTGWIDNVSDTHPTQFLCFKDAKR